MQNQVQNNPETKSTDNITTEKETVKSKETIAAENNAAETEKKETTDNRPVITEPEPLDYDTLIKVEISEDKMKAFLSMNPEYLPDNSEEKIENRKILTALQNAQVISGIKTKELQKAVAEFNKAKKPVQNLLIAEGIAEIMAKTSKLRLHKTFSIEDTKTITVKKKITTEEKDTEEKKGLLNKLKGLGAKEKKQTPDSESQEIEEEKKVKIKKTAKVLDAFTLVAEVSLPVKGQPGETVTGEKNLSNGNQTHVKEIIILAGKNIEKKEYGETIRYFTQYPGIVSLIDNRTLELEVILNSEYFIKIADDKKSVRLILKAPMGKGNSISTDRIYDELNGKGILYQDNIPKIEQKVKDMNETQNGSQEELIIARCKEPIHGTNGYIDFLVDFEQKVNYNTHKRIDHRERNMFVMVEKDQPLAQIHPPTDGIENGNDIFGNIIPAQKGKPCEITLTENIYQDDNLIKAKVDGFIYEKNDKIYVNPLLVIKKDVDFSVGNIRFKGDVTINGNILENFIVEAEGNITVKGAIEPATVKSGKNLVVAGGIFGKNKGKVITRESIQAKFIESANLQAEGNIHIKGYANQSKLRSKRQIMIGSGKKESKAGVILGGTIFAFEKIILCTVGNDKGGNNIHIVLGYNFEIIDKINATKGQITEIQFKILSLDNKIKNCSEEEKQEFSKQKNLFVQELNSIVQHQKELLKDLVNENPDAIYVIGSIYPGNKVQILDDVKEITEKMESAMFFLSENKKIGIKSIKKEN